MSLSSDENQAVWLFNQLSREFDLELLAAKEAGDSLVLECSTDFGVGRVIWFSAYAERELMRMEVELDGKQYLILAEPNRCSFRIYRLNGSQLARPVEGFSTAEQPKKQ
jgi:hypothetical protein